MKHFLFLLFIIFFPVIILPQNITPVRFDQQQNNRSNAQSFILGINEDDMIFFWTEDIFAANKLLYSRSTDAGNTWSTPQILVSPINNQANINLNAIVADSNKILFTYKSGSHYLFYSYDNGNTWTSYGTLPTGTTVVNRTRADNSFLSKDEAGNIYLTYSRRPDVLLDPVGLYYIKSSDNGNTWSEQITISPGGIDPCIISIDQTTLWVIYQDNLNGEIYRRISIDSGQSWSPGELIIPSGGSKLRPRAIKDINDKIWVFYQQYLESPFEDYLQPDILYTATTNFGNTWSIPEHFTNYSGIDEWHNVSTWNGEPVISFSSSRNYQIGHQYMQIYFGNSPDISTPPYLYNFIQNPSDEIQPNEPVTIKTFVDDDSGVDSVKIIIIKNVFSVDTLTMYDDGMHNDSLPGDNIYGIILPGFIQGDALQYYFLLVDNDNNIAGFNGGIIILPIHFSANAYKFDINRFKLPLNNAGILANVSLPGEPSGGLYDESSILFSGGFYLSGKSNDFMWANAVASASRVEDYQPGIVGSIPNDPKNSIYVIKTTDPPFGESWQNYSYAVELGADFYDGDGDGIYNPVDLNGNGIWDLNEDRPDILGDVTAWCVFNDGMPAFMRRFNVINPQGIEIHQTVFAVGNNIFGPAESMIFVRYRLINKGTVVNLMDSVYFATWADADIGEISYSDDLVGCDTTLNAGYTYNDGTDGSYGTNPPAIFLTLLQGPAVYIPGETFIDINSNGVFDPGIDTPLDTAFVNNGLFIGSEVLPGAKNLDMSSFVHYMSSHPTQGDPNTHVEARNYMLGSDKFGNLINPCAWTFGQVVGIPCNQVNPIFMYSGDPVANYGWINVGPVDQRMMVNTGPFELKANEPIDIWVGYVVGRGNSPLNSVTIGKEHVVYAHQYYRSNFFYLPVDVDDNNVLLTDFHLYQNYPNPFNPTTKIKFTIPQADNPLPGGARGGLITLIVYDVLGREVETLVNEDKPAGNYEVIFDASQYASGVYFYRLIAGSYSSVKKMVFLK